MKNIVIYTVMVLMLASCGKYMQDTITATCDTSITLDKTYSKKDTVQKLLQKYASLGIPGAVVALYNPAEGYWGTSAGYAKIETQTPMQLCHLQYLQSAAKMYMAAAVLKLHQEGHINLDAAITQYLPQQYSRCIDRASSVSVRNLLSHTSGIADYLESPVYITYVLQHPDYLFTSLELLGYIKNKKQQFAPGSRFEYSNTNFLILALIVDAIAGDHNEVIRQKILVPMGLNNTFYRNIKGQPALVNSYLDRFSTGVVENVSQLQQTSITFSKGDDGIIATPVDAINFLRALMEGRLLADTSLQKMMAWVKNGKGQPVYGLGLYHVQYNGVDGYGHGGAGAGAGCGLYYFPAKKLYIFLGTNIGTLVDGPITRNVNDLKNKLLELVLAD